jgi:hypothetical protein
MFCFGNNILECMEAGRHDWLEQKTHLEESFEVTFHSWYINLYNTRIGRNKENVSGKNWTVALFTS